MTANTQSDAARGRRRALIAAVTAGALSLGAVLAAGTIHMTATDDGVSGRAATQPRAQRAADDRRIVYSSNGWAFDMEDQQQVAGFSDSIVVAKAIDSGNPATIPNGPSALTEYRFQVQEELKGSIPAAEITVFQTGVDLSQDDVIVLEDGVERIIAGQTYVLALKESISIPGAFTLVSGPDSPQSISQTSRSTAIPDWEVAIQNEVWPEDLPPGK